MREIEKHTKAKIAGFETKSRNLMQYFVDTKKLAKSNNRFTKKQYETRYQGNYDYDFEIDENNRKIKRNKDAKRKKANKKENDFFAYKIERENKQKRSKVENSHFSKNKRGQTKELKFGKDSQRIRKNDNKKQKIKRDNVSKNKWYSKFERR